MGTDEHFGKTDMTDEQFYLEEMQKMNNQMINMQRELNRALMESRRMQEELKQNEELRIALEVSEKAGKAKMDFMSRMSHDLRTPMNVIMGLTAATLDEADHPEAVRENMAHIRSASDYMLGLINDILDMDNTEKDAVILKSEPYSYNEFL
ncbi:sensor histidine kinase [Hespellia stercorisuis]|uniref:histidine kinase n=1 Tax=Hespellia stercorisuis DSM 15480 TaxID=1121950 RepID=A0A1M6X6D3_9FIRM|nr:histidine kinase dimerization/phospho-acceptor domain-containing protein [Hespellia stercorisuis]SHL01498.1 His Kinase A (phospho-acceptor) domain-containing protein [Hespellia stercorisuis DSM 15480]